MLSSAPAGRAWRLRPPEAPGEQKVQPLLGLGIFLVYTALGVVGLWHVWAHPTSITMDHGTGDIDKYAWFLGWVPWAIAHGHNPLMSSWVNVPYGVNAMADTPMPALGLLGAPITAIWGPIATINMWFTLTFPLSAGAGYLLARRFTAWRPAAFAGGLLYGFSPYVVSQGIGHLNLMFVPLPPLIFLALHELFVRQQWPRYRVGLLLGVLVVGQFMITTEIVATTAVFALLTTIVIAGVGRRELAARAGHALVGLATAAALSVVVLAYPIYVELLAPGHISGGVKYHIFNSALAAPLLPTWQVVLGSAHLKAMGSVIGGNASENGTYLGIPLVLLIILAPLISKRRALRIASLMAVVAFIVSLGPRFHVGLPGFATVGDHLPLPAALINRIPLLNQVLPVRFTLYVDLFASLVLAIAMDELYHRHSIGSHRGASTSRRWRTAAGLLLAAVVLVPLIPAWPYRPQGPVRTPPFFTTASVDQLPWGSVALIYPLATAADGQPQLWQAQAHFRFKMPGGYFILPRSKGQGQQYFQPTLVEETLSIMRRGHAGPRSPALRGKLRAELARWRVQEIVADPVGAQPISWLTWLTGRPPDKVEGGVDIWSDTRW